MKEELISFQTAKLAKEKGFNEVTGKFWAKINQSDDEEVINKDYMTHKWNSLSKPIWSAPSQSVLQRWLREKHDLHVSLNYELSGYSCCVGGYDQINDKNKYIELSRWSTYEENLEEGLFEALKFIEK